MRRSTADVVKQAASILEEEIAAGIVAAREVEERFINVKELRGRNPDALMYRFRRDVHDIVDIVLDLLEVAVSSATSFSTSGRTLRDRGAQRGLPPPLPTLSVPKPIVAGETGTVMISVENDGSQEVQTLTFRTSDLVNAIGGKIVATCVKFTPPQVVLAPGTAVQVAVKIGVPKNTAPGVYTGMFQAVPLERVRAVLVVEICSQSAHQEAQAADVPPA